MRSSRASAAPSDPKSVCERLPWGERTDGTRMDRPHRANTSSIPRRRRAAHPARSARPPAQTATLISLIRECQGSAEVGVNHQPKLSRESAEAENSSLSRGHTHALWGRRGSNPRPRTMRTLSSERCAVTPSQQFNCERCGPNTFLYVRRLTDHESRRLEPPTSRR
jgi:hypothetical protein